jgi:hypothetical protein
MKLLLHASWPEASVRFVAAKRPQLGAKRTLRARRECVAFDPFRTSTNSF